MNSLSSALAIATTPAGVRVLTPYCTATQTPILIPASLQPEAERYAATGLLLQPYASPLRRALADQWPRHAALIFALATGAVVRLIAPLLQDKATDPAVVVVDESGQFVISLCGGHQGGSDRLAQQISRYLKATPVLTGAAQHHQLPGIDILGDPFGWGRGSGDWTGVASAIARGVPVQVIQEAGCRLWQQTLPAAHSLRICTAEGEAPASAVDTQAAARVWISPRQYPLPSPSPATVQWHPRVLWVGLGCERGTSQDWMTAAIAQVCQSHGLAMAAIAGVASLDLKADEAGLVQLCQTYHWPLRCFPATTLRSVPVPHPSAVVEQAVGTPSVAEAAALWAAQTPLTPLSQGSSKAFPGSLDGISQAPSAFLRVTKQVLPDPHRAGAVTLAIAQAPQEYTGRIGHLALVGTGPGRLDQITPAAQSALTGADVVIGYHRYIDLIRPLLRPGQLVEAWSITQEQQRAHRAVALANWGLSVAVVSSGDCGIYAMAGLVLETLQTYGWDGQQPSVESFPGISALQAAAARVGAPLMHDFCAISLSDLLTPTSVIETRLQAAAAADFVVALYNPKSQRRTELIAVVQHLFAQHRGPDTPVAIVHSAYRPHERIVLTTLADMLSHSIDMLTTVIIGNRSTRLYHGKLITPRGYTISAPRC